jgi:hypothetical protein
VTFLLTFALGLLGIVFAAAVLRVTLARDGRAPSWSRSIAVGVIAVLAASGLFNAGDTYRKLTDRRDHWAPVSEQDALENNSVGNHVDPKLTRFLKERLLRGETFYLTRNTPNETKLWLAYRLAPNLMEDRPDEADWIIYWQMPDAQRALGIAPEQVDRHEQWSPDVGMVKVRREG